MKIVYLARSDDNTLICVATDTDLYGSRFFIGAGSPLRQVPLAVDRMETARYPDGSVVEIRVAPINRYRDGGTTEIHTIDGLFHVPSPLDSTSSHPASPGGITYQDRRYTLMDSADTTAELTAEGLVLS